MEEGEIFLVEAETVLFTTLSKMGLKSTQALIQMVLWFFLRQ
jgi:hypothetical protein